MGGALRAAAFPKCPSPIRAKALPLHTDEQWSEGIAETPTEGSSPPGCGKHSAAPSATFSLWPQHSPRIGAEGGCSPRASRMSLLSRNPGVVCAPPQDRAAGASLRAAEMLQMPLSPPQESPAVPQGWNKNCAEPGSHQLNPSHRNQIVFFQGLYWQAYGCFSSTPLSCPTTSPSSSSTMRSH